VSHELNAGRLKPLVFVVDVATMDPLITSCPHVTASEDLSALKDMLGATLSRLRGPWIARRSHYETDCAAALGGTVATFSHWDCILPSGLKLELKKTQTGGMWFDLVRYSEAVLNPELASDVVTLILRYSLLPVPAITQVAAILHHDLLTALRLDADKARAVLALREAVPRALNAQARLTWTDLTAAANFVVSV
jgi:hypothetical protein